MKNKLLIKRQKRKLLLETIGKLFVWSSTALYMLFAALRRLGILTSLIYDIEVVDKRYIKIRGRYSYCLVGIISGVNPGRYGEGSEPVFIVRLGFDDYSKETLFGKIFPAYKKIAEFLAKGTLIFKKALYFMKKKQVDFDDAEFLMKTMKRMGYDPERSGMTIARGLDDLIRDVTSRLSASYLKKFIDLVKQYEGESNNETENSNSEDDDLDSIRIPPAAMDEFKDMLRDAESYDSIVGAKLPKGMSKFSFLPQMQRSVLRLQINGKFYNEYKNAVQNKNSGNEAEEKYLKLYKQLQDEIIKITFAEIEILAKKDEIQELWNKDSTQIHKMVKYTNDALELIKEYGKIDPKILTLYNNLRTTLIDNYLNA